MMLNFLTSCLNCAARTLRLMLRKCSIQMHRCSVKRSVGATFACFRMRHACVTQTDQMKTRTSTVATVGFMLDKTGTLQELNRALH